MGSEVEEELRRWRKEQNDYLKTDIERLIPEHKKGTDIKELDFFAPDAAYRFRRLKLNKYPEPQVVAMSDAKGRRTMNYLRVGYFELKINGKKIKIQAYVEEDAEDSSEKEEKQLFIPFRDLTSGKESYEGARYLQLKVNDEDDEYDLDFNFAYNPNCAYSDSWACMLPPKENWLDVEIRAGERKYNAATFH